MALRVNGDGARDRVGLDLQTKVKNESENTACKGKEYDVRAPPRDNSAKMRGNVAGVGVKVGHRSVGRGVEEDRLEAVAVRRRDLMGTSEKDL